MTKLITKRNLRIFIAVVIDVILIAFMAFLIYYLLGLTGHRMVWYFVLLGAIAIAILLSNLSVKTQVTYFALAVIFSYLGMAVTLFLLIERVYFSKIEMRQFVNKNKYIAPQKSLENKYKEYAKMALYINKCTNFPVVYADNIKYYSKSIEYLDEIISCIKSAKRYVYLEYYIIKQGVQFSKLLTELFCALERNVIVEITVDFFGAGEFIDTQSAKALKESGAIINVYKPPIVFLGMNFNTRTHRKIVVIDGEIGFLGGVNFGNEKDRPSKDGGLKLTGDAVIQLENMFFRMKGVALNTNYKKSSDECGYIQPFSVHGRHTLEKLVTAMLYVAKKSIIISTPYLSFSKQTLSAFEYAVYSGVSVKVLIPEKVCKFVWYINKSYAKELEKIGVEVYVYKPEFLHEKMIVIDDKLAQVGSCNFDLRSLSYQIESGALIYNNSVIKEFILDFNISLSRAERASFTGEKIIFTKLLCERFFRLFSYFI